MSERGLHVSGGDAGWYRVDGGDLYDPESQVHSRRAGEGRLWGSDFADYDSRPDPDVPGCDRVRGAGDLCYRPAVVARVGDSPVRIVGAGGFRVGLVGAGSRAGTGLAAPALDARGAPGSGGGFVAARGKS